MPDAGSAMDGDEWCIMRVALPTGVFLICKRRFVAEKPHRFRIPKWVGMANAIVWRVGSFAIRGIGSEGLNRAYSLSNFCGGRSNPFANNNITIKRKATLLKIGSKIKI